ncbi:hypothetical protein Malapachy_0275 [Malassezia pachydermatis]|uniref:WLM domain-containing protein n=1 Tax=Malassezia pachydermatis TaxID=77020 RepID=A0A0M8MJ46_9BASI|nr:hypothetical protein Malapachy_0275 [Malassezia pachydermatis]KOS13496.1 hypothetical protein Malapachy_0275 [Malassezia pachydermatis]
MSVIGATESEIAKVQEQDEKMAVKQKPRQFHPSLLKNSSPRRTPSSSLGPPVFGRCGAHSSTPEGSPLQADVVKYLERLASDPAVLHVCKLHSYQVGLLSELLPHENPELLGLNVNKGEKILLRIRTDEEDGFRDYKTTRRVLMHELAHNEISDHPPEFKILNSQLNREVESFERSRARGTHVLDTTPMYQPVPGRDIEEDLEERRLRILAATEARLAKLDQDIDAGCGSGGANLS